MPRIRIGLTGGIGSGKTAVAEAWRARGATIVDADVLAREVVERGTDGLRAIARRWPHVIRPDGTLNRSALATIVFNDAAQRVHLNAIVHPRVRALGQAREDAAPVDGVVVHVVPLLLENHTTHTYDAVVTVIAPDDARLARVMERDGVDRASVLARMHAQIDPAEARGLSSHVIENDGDHETLIARANALYDALTST